jgi:hypothetical protein
MMQYVCVKLNPSCHGKSGIQQEEDFAPTNSTFFTIKVDLNVRREQVQCYIWSMALCGAETWTLREVDQKYLESFGM